MTDVAARALGRACSTPDRIQMLDRLHHAAAGRAAHTRAFEQFVGEYQPGIAFCAHQRAPRAVPAMIAAKKAGAPAATFIYSWDNVPKGRMAVPSDFYLVWSEHMKNEVLGYYPDVLPNQVKVVGTPQFENYFNKSLLRARDDFFGEFGLDQKRPVVCFSGNDVNSPYDPIFLSDLAEGMRAAPPARRPQILLRRSPVDRTKRYDAVLQKYPEIIVCDPAWQAASNQNWSQMVPTRQDVALLINVVYHCDLVVNLGSTMAMDFAAYNKPAVYAAYNPQEGRTEWDVNEAYALPHFKTAHQLQPVYWARSPGDLRDMVLRGLQHPEEKQDARLAWLRLHVMQPMDQACQRFSHALRNIAIQAQRESAFQPAGRFRRVCEPVQ